MAWTGNENMNHSKASMHSDKRDIVFSVHRKSKDSVRQLQWKPIHELFNGSAGLRFTPTCGYLWGRCVGVENTDTWQTSMDNAALTCSNRDSTWSDADIRE